MKWTPEKAVVEKFREAPIVGAQLDNIVTDFEKACADMDLEAMGAPEQGLVNSAFCFFIMGMEAVMNPGSNFNKKYRMNHPGNKEVM